MIPGVAPLFGVLDGVQDARAHGRSTVALSHSISLGATDGANDRMSSARVTPSSQAAPFSARERDSLQRRIQAPRPENSSRAVQGSSARPPRNRWPR